MAYLPCIEIEPQGEADAALIWLHGLGANGHDFEPIVPELALPDAMKLRFVFPHSPSIPVTINGGIIMPAWYDILSLGAERSLNLEQLRASASAVQDLVSREIGRGIDSRRIVLAGFSQGGAVAYEAALSYPEPLGGLMVLSSYFPTDEDIELAPANRQLPIHVFHGSQDPVVHQVLGQMAKTKLEALGFKPGYTSYHMEHGVCAEEIADISAFLQRQLR